MGVPTPELPTEVHLLPALTAQSPLQQGSLGPCLSPTLRRAFLPGRRHCPHQTQAPRGDDSLTVTQAARGRAGFGGGLGSWPFSSLPTFGTPPESPHMPMDASVCVPHSAPGPSSVWGAEARSRLGVTGRPMAVAVELAGGAVAARGAGSKAAWGLQAGRAGTLPGLGVTGAAVSTAAGLVTLRPPHPWAARCERRVEGGHQGSS